MKIYGIGETVMDMVFRNDQPQAAVPGGSTFNAVISIGRTVPRLSPATEIYMSTQIGDDHVGDIICNFLLDNNVKTELVKRYNNTQTNVSMAFLNDRNDAQYEFYKDPKPKILRLEDAGEINFEKGDILLIGSFFAVDPAVTLYLGEVLKAARKAGATIYYDINFRKNHLAELPHLLPIIEENCRYCDFVKGSDEDFLNIYGIDNPEEVYEKRIKQLCPNLIYTQGPDPVHVFSPGVHGEYPVRKVKPVSTIGAGDNFNAGFIAGLVKFGADSQTPLTEALWSKLVGNATRYSSAVCESMFNYVEKDFEA
ncbi:MAG: PfkB family carbohydrate kinase [Bacteroidales bacterium]|nr:PfkB family carbohydrate kinase [Bacteroidales bacterium]